MILYLINAILATFIAFSFYKSVDGILRVIMILLFSAFAFYQYVMVGVVAFDFMEHGTWYSRYSKLPFTIMMMILTIYMYREKLLKLYKKCLNFLTRLQKIILK